MGWPKGKPRKVRTWRVVYGNQPTRPVLDKDGNVVETKAVKPVTIGSGLTETEARAYAKKMNAQAPQFNHRVEEES